MRRNYGPSVQQDVIEQLVNDQVTQILEGTERVIYLGRPEVTQLPSAGKPLSFKLEYELRPKLDPIGYMGLEVERPSTEVSAERIDERIEQLREQHATLQPIEGRETIEDGDSVELDFRAVGDEPELEDLHGEDVTIVVGRGQAMPGIEQALRGAAFDGTLKTTVELEESFPVETLRGREVELELTIKGVQGAGCCPRSTMSSRWTRAWASRWRSFATRSAHSSSTTWSTRRTTSPRTT